MNTSKQNVVVDRLVSVIGETVSTRFYCKDGGTIEGETPPGCWGPMITPRIYGGHEVTEPVYVEGAEPGDSIAIYIESVQTLTPFCTSGTRKAVPGNFEGDPSVNAICPHCHIHHPETYIDEIGDNSVKCSKCHNPIIPQTYENGYTVAYDRDDDIAVAVAPEGAARIAEMTLRGEVYRPKDSVQHLATVLGRADFYGLPIRQRLMVGNIGCVPAVSIPASKNAGDYFETLSKTDLFQVPRKEEITDAHMDVNLVGEGCVVIAPVLVKGAGVYFGDVHLVQGCGEIAGHTLDISARVRIRVKVLKHLTMQGPILLPRVSELDSRFCPFTQQEYQKAQKLYSAFCGGTIPLSYPIQVVGSGDGMDAAFENALERCRTLTGLSMGEIMNRVTVGGEIRVGRTSGTVYLTIMLEEKTLQQLGMDALVKEHYQL